MPGHLQTLLLCSRRQEPPAEPLSTANASSFASFLAIAASILGGAILQVFLSPPDVAFAPVADNPGAFGWCWELGQCADWQRTWQLSCLLSVCFVILSILGCSVTAVSHTAPEHLAVAVATFLAGLFSTVVAVCIEAGGWEEGGGAGPVHGRRVCHVDRVLSGSAQPQACVAPPLQVLSIVFLSFGKSVCLATVALLLLLLLLSLVLFGWRAIVFGLDGVVFGRLLWRAAQRGDERCVRRMVWAGAHIDSLHSLEEGELSRISNRPKSITPLFIAAAKGHAKIVQLLIEHGACLAAVDGDGSTALLIAAANLQVEVVKVLLLHANTSSGVDPWAHNLAGWTPMLAALKASLRRGPGIGRPGHLRQLQWGDLAIASKDNQLRDLYNRPCELIKAGTRRRCSLTGLALNGTGYAVGSCNKGSSPPATPLQICHLSWRTRPALQIAGSEQVRQRAGPLAPSQLAVAVLLVAAVCWGAFVLSPQLNVGSHSAENEEAAFNIAKELLRATCCTHPGMDAVCPTDRATALQFALAQGRPWEPIVESLLQRGAARLVIG